MEKIDNIVLNIPHSATFLPHPKDWVGDIETHIKRWTDTKTDIIFKSDNDSVHSVVFPLSRFYCDVERMENDALEVKGQGIYYTNFEDCHRDKTAGYYLVKSIYYNHWFEVANLLTPTTLLIDCHSFPADLSDVDVCIGINQDFSKPSAELLNLIVSHFSDLGFKVAVNEPYANTIVPITGFEYKSVMLELNKSIYLTNNELSPDAYKLNHHINYLYKKILQYGTTE